MRQLIMFDVDGTLTQSTLADGACYAQAMSEHLGIEIEPDWSTYRHSTDTGIAHELFARAGRPVPLARDLEPVRRRFLTLLKAALTTDRGACAPVAGAAPLIQHLHAMSGVFLSIATGAWEDAARLKLRQAALPVVDLPFASSDDAVERAEILTISLARATAQAGVKTFDAVTYVGDQPWDVVAAQTVGFRFVGVSEPSRADRLRAAGATTVVPNFANAHSSLFV